MPFALESIRDAAVYAIADLKETTFETAETKAKNISFVRRYRMKDGYVATKPGVLNKYIDHAIGQPNETVKLVKLVREDADDIFIVNFGTHPDSVGGELFTEIGNRICADSPCKTTIMCALTNSEGAYIPTRKAYEEGGYEARSSSLRPGGDDIIVDGMKELVSSL